MLLQILSQMLRVDATGFDKSQLVNVWNSDCRGVRDFQKIIFFIAVFVFMQISVSFAHAIAE